VEAAGAGALLSPDAAGEQRTGIRDGWGEGAPAGESEPGRRRSVRVRVCLLRCLLGPGR